MEQTYTLEVNDYLQFQAFLRKRNPKYSHQRYLLMLVAPGLVAVATSLLRLPWEAILLFTALAAALWIPYLLWAFRKTMSNQLKLTIGARGLFTAVIDPTRLSIEGPIHEMRTRWEKIIEITESEHQLVFLYSPAYGSMIPKAAFRDAEHAHEFLETARAYQNGMLSDAPTSTAWPPPPRRMDKSGNMISWSKPIAWISRITLRSMFTISNRSR
ncbi:MAG: YcxB family protein [Capsulimonas sp.]|uniref:YcxB family protein n=1 Tax=Capsulimonas sp. TaxID=2494211 RepID=UPI003262E6C4